MAIIIMIGMHEMKFRLLDSFVIRENIEGGKYWSSVSMIACLSQDSNSFFCSRKISFRLVNEVMLIMIGQ